MAQKVISAIIIEECDGLTLEEFSHTIRVENDIVIEMVEHHLLQPQGKHPKEWRFDSECLRRAKMAVSFQRDLEINYPGISLALDLLEQIEALENELNTLKKISE